jgi:DNA-binding NarL/FixJ family response regulator
VLVVDARRLFADALAGLLAGCSQVLAVGSASLADADCVIRARRPDLVLLGAVDGETAAGALPRIRGAHPGGQVVFVADRLDCRLVRLVLGQRLGGLLLSDVSAGEIAECLAQVGRGHCVLPAGWQAALDPAAGDPREQLSTRQGEVLELLAEGCAYGEIAARLGISLNTVKFHTRSIFARLGVRNRVAAVHRLTSGQ